MNPKRLLLIEDDPTIAELLAYNLRHAGYEVLLEIDGRAGLDAGLSNDIDLALVDVLLPGLDGMSVSRELAVRKPHLPVIILTALSERETMLEGFAAGADDYVVKPFDLEELMVRIAARLRRTAAKTEELRIPVSISGISLEEDTHTLCTDAGKVFLKPKEYDLLQMLLSDPGHLFGRDEITRRVWQQRYIAASRTLDVHIRALRVKLQTVSAPAEIYNVRGVGYRIDSVAENPSSAR